MCSYQTEVKRLGAELVAGACAALAVGRRNCYMYRLARSYHALTSCVLLSVCVAHAAQEQLETQHQDSAAKQDDELKLAAEQNAALSAQLEGSVQELQALRGHEAAAGAQTEQLEQKVQELEASLAAAQQSSEQEQQTARPRSSRH